jgi:hypothetical protein
VSPFLLAARCQEKRWQLAKERATQHVSKNETAMEVLLACMRSPVRLRRPTPTKETDKEQAEGKANAKPDCGQLQNIRTMKPCKARVPETVHQWRNPHRQDGERCEHRPLFSPFGFHGKQSISPKRSRSTPSRQLRKGLGR